ncbi:MAG: hypothetical protein JWP01_3988 [Myxococcales bacterium]|nr:hypothetical protein [Myxococcales bacterium]
MNASDPVADVGVTVRDPQTLAQLGQVVSAANGAYAVDIATGGAPVPIAIDYVKSGFWSTRAFPDLPIDRDTMGNGLPLWSTGDAPVWTPAAMGMVFTASGVTRDVADGFLNIAVRDCAGNPVPGVNVSISPSAGSTIRYQSSSGTPSQSLTVTDGPFAHVLAINVPAGLVTVTATLPGRGFLNQQVMVQGGDVVTLAVVRALD